jgi:hypothetical protein
VGQVVTNQVVEEAADSGAPAVAVAAEFERFDSI